MEKRAVRRRVAITGIGVVSPLGGDRESTWRRVCAGERGVRWLPELCAAGAPAAIELAPDAEPVVALALQAADEAVRHAGLAGRFDRERTACVIGTSKGCFRSFARLANAERETGGSDRRELAARCLAKQDDCNSADRASPSACWPNAAALAVASRWNVRGPVLCPVAACATGLTCLIRGADLIRQGDCDVALAGSADASLEPILVACYRRLGVLAPATADDAAYCCRPFDRRRAGFAVGEGAAVLVLEELQAARSRGAEILAEWRGGALASDPTHITRLESDPESLVWVIRAALRDAGMSPAGIDCVQLHGTATRQNDAGEARAVRTVFGDLRPACSGVKGAVGHLLGAAGSLEAALAALAVRDGVVPPTVNLEDCDDDCAAGQVIGAALHRPVGAALKLSLGFGGHIAAAVIGGVT